MLALFRLVHMRNIALFLVIGLSMAGYAAYGHTAQAATLPNPNEEIASGIIRIRAVSSPSHPGFNFVTTGDNGLPSDVSVNGTNAGTFQDFTVTNTGPYTVTEVNNPGWVLGAQPCVLASNGTAVTQPFLVPNGDRVTCSFVFSQAQNPDLVISQNNTLVSGHAEIGTAFNWVLTVSNAMPDTIAAFSILNPVLTDDLPAGFNYSTPTVTVAGGASGGATCTINNTGANPTLSCTSLGSGLTMPAGSTITVTIPTVASSLGTFVHPASGGNCSVDIPGNVVIESDETNNNCNSASVTIDPHPSAHILVHKVTAPSSDTTTAFTLRLDGTPSLNGDALRTIHGGEVVDYEVSPGSFSITEPSTPSHWQVTGNDCSGTVAAGDTVNCTITNAQFQTLTITSQVINDNGGTKTVADFPVFRNGTPIAVNTPLQVPVQAFTITTPIVAGYQTTFSGDCSTNGQVIVGAGEDKNCIVTNNDIAYVNHSPIASNVSETTNADVPAAIILSAQDQDIVNGDTISFHVLANPTRGTLSGTAPNLTYTPSGIFTGSDSFTYNVSDSQGATSNTATVLLTINPASSPLFATEATGTPAAQSPDSSITITWATDHPATSRVVYDTVSHTTLGTAPNYGYAFSTTENPALVTNHSVTISGLNASTTYFFRSVSHGSPEAVGSEEKTKTLAPVAPTGTAEIRGSVYEDKNGSGILLLDALLMRKLSGWTIYLDANGNGNLDPGERTKVTDANGNYSFIGLAAGSYTVREVVQAGWKQTAPSNGKHAITLKNGQSKTRNDFGNFKLSSVSGTVFEDKNGNKKQDTGELGLSGWNIILKSGSGTFTATSGANGSYQFVNVGPGLYSISETVQNGWKQITNTPSAFIMLSGTPVLNQNFGNKKK